MSANKGTTLSEPVQSILRTAIQNKLPERIWSHDPAIWKTDDAARKSIENRLGWLDAPEHFLAKLDEIVGFAKEVRDASITSIVLLGMGGSSLCVEVIRDTFGVKSGHPQLEVLDSTHPDQILRTERAVDLAKTLFIVASKSGTTLESDSLFNYFWDKLEFLGPDRGSHFVAITDPGTLMEQIAHASKFRKAFLNPPDIGGRFSVLSYFGLVPAALIGVDIKELLSRAGSEAGLSRSEDEHNTSLILAAFLEDGLNRGKDKMTLYTDPAIATFGNWAEQLVAESTGKEGKGILPIVGETATATQALSDDRIYVHLTFGESTMDDSLHKSPDHLEMHLADAYDLGAQFFRWEFATAAVGALMGINPFDEPNVTEAKTQTARVLSQYDGRTALTFPEQKATIDGVSIAGDITPAATVSATLSDFLKQSVKPGSYIAIMAYVDRSEAMQKALAQLQSDVGKKFKVPVTIGYGPRFLHSTGQLHKGGPNTGVFLQLIDKPKENILVPTKHYDFGTLILGQAIGDFEALRVKKKPVLSLNLGIDPLKTLQSIAH